MKIRKFLKKILYVSLAVLVAVTALPNVSFVEAASDEYPPDIQFPIKVLDFPQDNLLFEWFTDAGADDLALGDMFHGHAGWVEDTLGPDGLPVYKKEAVETAARGAQRRLHWGHGDSKIFGTNHYLNAQKYMRGNGEAILSESTNKNVSDSTIWVPDSPGPVRLEKQDGGTHKYVVGGHQSTFGNVYAEVYDDSISSTKPVYILSDEFVVFFYNIPVSKTFTLLPNTTYTIPHDYFEALDTKALITGKDGTYEVDQDYYRDIQVTTNDSGELKVTLAPDVSTPIGEELEDDYIMIGDIFAASPMQMEPAYLGTNPNGGRVRYPFGNYEESKAKYDGNPDLGWTDMRTCMDYAYFVTSHFWKYHPSLNVQYNDYENLIFHKIDAVDGGNPSYEFSGAYPDLGDAHDGYTPSPAPAIIYNKTNKTIRNEWGSDHGDTTRGDVVKPGGSMFILDESTELMDRYPGVDVPLADNRRQPHNFHFSVSSHSNFVYKEGAKQYFYFVGDDDVYVFVNGHLYIDLGGAHQPLYGSVNLDDVATEHPEWGIESGKPVSLDLFYLERHSSEANFYAKMNFKLATDEIGFDMPYEVIPYGYLVDLKYSLTTYRELVRDKNITFKDNFGNVIGAEDFHLADGCSLRHKADTDMETGVLTVTVTKEDGSVDDTRSRVFEFPNLYAYNPASNRYEKKRELTSAEIAAVKDYFKNVELVQGEKIGISGVQYDTSYKKYEDYEELAGEGTQEKGITFKPEVHYDVWQEGAFVATKGFQDKTVPIKLQTASFKVCTAQTNNEKKELADYGKFTIERDLFGESIYAMQPCIGLNDERMPYTNNPSILAVIERNFDKMPIGKYKIKLDDTVLVTYKVTVNDEEVKDLTLDLQAEYDPDTGTWVYYAEYESVNNPAAKIRLDDPNIKFELRAKRRTPELKDLT